ncbi:hypothetical protein GCM10009678_73020 [Actinomadura kijaniata]|uniref:Uncharacterized protein n=1 Tax=Actinomadura namibiensis TaxID=182080 RepID=A0A7W3QSM7_ACTNM|nr:hypothetical protein [Actinomadura namibiensis]
MNEQCPADEPELARLRALYTGHRIWRAIRYDGLPGDWVATLRDSSEGVDPTVIRTSADELRKALDVERARAARRSRP